MTKDAGVAMAAEWLITRLRRLFDRMDAQIGALATFAALSGVVSLFFFGSACYWSWEAHEERLAISHPSKPIRPDALIEYARVNPELMNPASATESQDAPNYQSPPSPTTAATYLDQLIQAGKQETRGSVTLPPSQARPPPVPTAPIQEPQSIGDDLWAVAQANYSKKMAEYEKAFEHYESISRKAAIHSSKAAKYDTAWHSALGIGLISTLAWGFCIALMFVPYRGEVQRGSGRIGKPLAARLYSATVRPMLVSSVRMMRTMLTVLSKEVRAINREAKASGDSSGDDGTSIDGP